MSAFVDIVDALEGALIGGLAAAVIIYGFQTKVAYPEVVLGVIDHPWMVVLAFLGLSFIATKGHHEVTALLLLLLVAFVMDTTLFARSLPQRQTHPTEDPHPAVGTIHEDPNRRYPSQPTSEYSPLLAFLEDLQFPVFHEIQDDKILGFYAV